MYAIVDIAGQQFKVQKAQKLFVHRLTGETGSKVSFDKVLLIENNGKITVGDPVIKEAAVSAKVLEHVKGDKVLVFKKKRRKGYQKLNGHRQYLTQIEITDINEKGGSKSAAKPAEKASAAPEKKATASKAAPKTDDASKSKTGAVAEKKPAAAKKAAAEKKPAAKAAAAKSTAPKAAPAKKQASPKAESTEKKAAAKKPAAKKAEGKAEDDK